MNSITVPRILQGSAALALFGGVLWAMAFPKIGLAGAGWLAPGLILFSGIQASSRRRFLLGYIAGLAHSLIALYWLLLIPFPVGAVAGWLALSAYLALYPAVWVWLCWKVWPIQTPPTDCHAGLITWAQKFLSAGWGWRFSWAVFCAATWVGLEMIVVRLFTGFPWGILGVSQYQNLPLIQITSITGVYGVSFLMVWLSICLVYAGLLILQKPRQRSAWAAELGLPLLVLLGVMLFGLRSIRQETPSESFLKVALVQPSIPQRLIFDPKENPARFRQLLSLSELALSTKPDVLIWPEASMPSFDEENFAAITNLIRRANVWMIFGADDVQSASDGMGNSRYQYFNSCFLFNPEGKYVATYRKRRLVIFGEYIPLVRYLPIIKYLTPIEGGFTSGDKAETFVIDRPRARISPLICFEDVFADLTRGCVDEQTDFLLNLTNNGWFGESAAQWQHAANAVFRAVENGLPLVRCTNNGLTCWIDRHGRMFEVYSDDSRDIYKAGFKTARIPLLKPGETRALTYYTRNGDRFGWGCLTFSLAIFGLRLPRRRHMSPAAN